MLNHSSQSEALKFGLEKSRLLDLVKEGVSTARLTATNGATVQRFSLRRPDLA